MIGSLNDASVWEVGDGHHSGSFIAIHSGTGCGFDDDVGWHRALGGDDAVSDVGFAKNVPATYLYAQEEVAYDEYLRHRFDAKVALQPAVPLAPST